MSFVLDASVVLAWCFSDESTPESTVLLESLTQTKAWVPSIWPLEVSNSLLSCQRRNRISYEELTQCISLIQQLPIEIDHSSAASVFHTTLSLAHEFKLTSYDASYLELAIRRSLPLATRDKALASAAIQKNVKLIRIDIS